MTGFVPASRLYDPVTGERFPHPAEQVDRGDRVIADGGLEHECPVCGARYYSQGAADACCGLRNVLVTDGGRRSSGTERPESRLIGSKLSARHVLEKGEEIEPGVYRIKYGDGSTVVCEFAYATITEVKR